MVLAVHLLAVVREVAEEDHLLRLTSPVATAAMVDRMVEAVEAVAQVMALNKAEQAAPVATAQYTFSPGNKYTIRL